MAIVRNEGVEFRSKATSSISPTAHTRTVIAETEPASMAGTRLIPSTLRITENREEVVVNSPACRDRNSLRFEELGIQLEELLDR